MEILHNEYYYYYSYFKFFSVGKIDQRKFFNIIFLKSTMWLFGWLNFNYLRLLLQRKLF